MKHQRLSKYLKIDALIKRLTAEKESIRDEIIKAAEHNEEFPGTYRVTVKEHERRSVASLEDIRDKSQKLYDALESAGCIKLVKQTRVTVKHVE